MTQDTATKVATYWNDIADKFDSIYSGQKNPVAKALDRWLRQDMFQRFDWVMRKAGKVQDSQICDIGCGSGRFVVELAKRGAKRLVGVDVAPEMLRLAKEHVTTAGVAERCEFVHADVENWKTTDRFDLVIAIGFWDYIADPRSRLQNIRSMTKGRFLSAWPRAGTWRVPIRKARLSALGCPVFFYRKEDILRQLEEVGFKTISVERLGQLYCIESSVST